MPKKLTDILGASLSSQGVQGLQGIQGLSNQGSQGLQGLQGPIGNVSYQLETDTTPKLIADLDLNGNTITNGSISNCTISNPGLAYTCYAIVQHKTAYNAGGGSFIENAWRNRTINHIEYDPHNILTLSNSIISLVPGTYHFQAQAQAMDVDQHNARIYDVENEVGFGTSPTAYSSDAGFYATNTCHIYTKPVTLTTNPHRIRVQHRCQYSGSLSGIFGFAHDDANMGDNRFLQVIIYKH